MIATGLPPLASRSDGHGGRRTGRLNVNGTIDFGSGHKRENYIDVEARGEIQAHRRGCVETERKRAARRDDQPRHDRRAERDKFSKPLSVEPFDRQSEERFAPTADEHWPSGVEFGDPAIDANLPFGTELTRNHAISDRTHISSYQNFLWPFGHRLSLVNTAT